MKFNKTDLNFIHDMLAKLDDKLDDINDIQKSQAETLIRHDENLKIHMKRSDKNEEAIELLKSHVQKVQGAAAFISLLALLAGIYAVVR